MDGIVEILRPLLEDSDPIIEIGSGTGRLIQALNLNIIGIDISAGLTNIAKNRTRSPYILGDGRTLSVAGVDAAYCVTVFQHLPWEGVKSYIFEVSKVLKLGGIFIFQWIEGTEKEPFSQHHSLELITETLNKANLELVSYTKGLVEPLWSWAVSTSSSG